MNTVFLDTSGLIAVVNADDQWHDQAESVWRDLIGQQVPLLLTSLVLIEIGDGLSRIHHRQLAIELYDRLHHSSRVEIVPATQDVEAQGWRLFRERADKEWGMTDCVSMVIMQNRSVRRVFSTDRHFQQAGFEVLL